MRLTYGHYIFVGIFAITQCVLVYLLFSLTGVAYYRLQRIHNLINMEFAMVLGSMFIWRKVTAAISHWDPDKLTPARFRWRTICFQDVARASLLILLALSQFSFLFYFLLLGTEPHLLAQISFIGLAAYLHIVVFLITAELIHIGSTVFLKYGVFQSVSRWITSNRHVIIFLSLFCALFFVLGGLYTTFSDPVYTHVSITLKKLHNDELRVALLSDLHIGPSVGQKRMETIVRLTNDLNPDVIAISGDLADGFVKYFGKAASPLCSLSAKHGVYFASGNHEYMHGNVEEWFSYLQACNITVLHNLQRRFTLRHGDNICVAGADDLFAVNAKLPGHLMDAHRAVEGCRTDDVVIMLAHQPNAASVMLNDPVVNKKLDVILSGHTHGGQMYLFVPIIYVMNAFVRGLYHYAATGTYVYVSAGVNYFGPPVKVFGACEIIDIILKPAI